MCIPPPIIPPTRVASENLTANSSIPLYSADPVIKSVIALLNSVAPSDIPSILVLLPRPFMNPSAISPGFILPKAKTFLLALTASKVNFSKNISAPPVKTEFSKIIVSDISISPFNLCSLSSKDLRPPEETPAKPRVALLRPKGAAPYMDNIKGADSAKALPV